MHNWNNNYDRGFDGMHLLMPLSMLLFLALGIWLVAVVLRRNGLGLTSSNVNAVVPTSAQQILNERLARGEISEEEFSNRSQALKAAGQ